MVGCIYGIVERENLYKLLYCLRSHINWDGCGNKMPTRCNRGFFIFIFYFYSTKYHRQQPLYNTLELLMMGIMMPETC